MKVIKQVYSIILIVLFCFLAFSAAHAAIIWDDFTFRYDVVENSADIYNVNNNRFEPETTLQGPTPQKTNNDEENDPVDSQVDSSSPADPTGLGLQLKAGAGGRHLSSGARIEAYVETSTTSGGVLLPYAVGSPGVQNTFAFSNRNFHVDTNQPAIISGMAGGVINDPGFSVPPFLRADYDWEGGITLDEIATIQGIPLVIDSWFIDFDDMLDNGPQELAVNLRTQDGSGNPVSYTLRTRLDLESYLLNYDFPDENQAGNIPVGKLGSLGAVSNPLWIDAGIDISTEPVLSAAFTGNPLIGSSPLQVNFTDQSIGDISSRQWNFGDGSPVSNDENPSHSFADVGTYTVSLTVTGPLGSDTETKTDYITVETAGTPPQAAFSGDPLTGTSPLQVDFTDESTGDISSRQWNFGDGSPVSNETDPSHSFADVGTYTVSLTVTGPLGSDTETKTDYITVGTAPNAAFTGDPLTGTSPLQVNFTDQSTGDISSRQWNFGDGSPVSNETDPSHSFSDPGTYTVSLTVTGPLGSNTETKTDYITVQTTGTAPVAAFTGNPLEGPSPLQVNFTDQSTGDISSRQWNFGDGSPVSNETDPSHSFSDPGTYTVSLTVTGPLGSNTETKTDYITVQTTGTAPVAAFTGNPLEGPSPLQVNFTDQSTGDISSRQWNFGDGSPVSNETDPSHSFSDPGTYTVSLTVTGPLGSDTETKIDYITVQTTGTAPVAAFTGNPVEGPSPLQVNFTDQSTGDISSRQWNFGDGSPVSNETDPSHSFSDPGTYTVSLTVTGPLGSNTETKTDYITVQTAGTKPNAAFIGNPLEGPSPLQVNFTDRSTGEISSRQWVFGDGLPGSNDKNPTHVYSEIGTFTVSLKVTGPLGSDTETKTDYITVTCPAGTYTISGYIHDTDDIPLEGVSIEANNCGTSDTTSFDGFYEILVPADWSGLVTLFYKEGYVFNPTKRTYTDVATDMADQNFTGRLDIQISDLVAYYPFNGYADDVSGNENHGVTRGASLTLDRFATANSAYRFDGRLDYIVIPKSDSLQPVNAFTIAAWSMPLGFYSGTCQANAILYNGTDQDIGFYGIGYSDQGYAPDCSVFEPDKQSFFFEIKFDDGTSEYINAQNFINPDRWYSVVATYDGIDMKIYVNGALQNVLTVAKQLGNNNDSLTIGTQLVSSYPYWVNGKIDDVRIYNRALTQDEVEQLFEYEKPLDFNMCQGDFDEDGNVDGDDLFELIKAEKGVTLKSFGEEFGRIDCD